MNLNYAPGATPLDPDEIEGLMPKHITTQGQLNEWEQANILHCEMWLLKQSLTLNDVLDISFVQKLHKKMFSDTWSWAGTYRKTNKNIGVFWEKISVQTKNLIDDVLFQNQHQTYGHDEIAIKFHHRLVAIHCFPNGNGRHARLITDLYLQSQDVDKFTWGRENLVVANDSRNEYINALRCADKHDYAPSLNFSRS